MAPRLSNFPPTHLSGDFAAFKIKFTWGRNQGRKNMPDKPSLDRIIPKLGYVKHNVAFISLNANRIKQDVEEKEVNTLLLKELLLEIREIKLMMKEFLIKKEINNA